jgi:hypothetical protein
VFGATCDKYWPMKAINGLIIELQFENPVECLCFKFVPYYTDTENAIARFTTKKYGGFSNVWIFLVLLMKKKRLQLNKDE